VIVVDASVAVKWFLKEEHSDCAITLTTLNIKLVGPALAQYEVAGAFIRACRRQDIDAQTAAECRDQWLRSVSTNVMRLEGDDRDIVRGSELAVSLQHPLSDCIYLAMAERLDIPLITADAIFHEKAKVKHHSLFVDGVLKLTA